MYMLSGGADGERKGGYSDAVVSASDEEQKSQGRT